MGAVLQFKRRNTPALDCEELELLDRLRGSLQSMWRGGWAEPGEYGGVTLLRNRHCLGIWCFERDGFVYRPIESGVAMVKAPSVEEAYTHTLLLLGELLPD